MLKKKIWANFQRTIELFTQKIVTKLSKIWVWDPGSKIWDPEKTYSGSRIQESKRHWIPVPGSATLVGLRTKKKAVNELRVFSLLNQRWHLQTRHIFFFLCVPLL
jgi:hypothetical protein